jgi:hypothetical protein
MSCCFDVTTFRRKGVAAQRRGDGISALIRQFAGTPCVSRFDILPRLRRDPLPLEGGVRMAMVMP